MGEKNTSATKLQCLPLGSIISRGWLARQLRLEAAGMCGCMDELEPAMLATPYTTRERNDKISVGWNAEISGEYWCGLVLLAFASEDPALRRKVGAWVDGVLAAQEEDGYLGAYRKTDDRREDYNPWGVQYAVRALLSYHEATGRAEVLEACRRGLLWFVDHWAGHKTDYAGPSIIEACVLVHLKTGDPRLLAWAEEYFAWLGGHSRWPNHLQAMAGPDLDYNAAHTVAYGVWIQQPLALYHATGRREYLDAAVNAMRKVVRKCFQETGAPSSNFEYLSPPGALCETEYCNFTVYAEGFIRLLMATADPAYGDRLERIVFNGSQGAKTKDGRSIAYMSSPNQQLATMTSSNYGPNPSMNVYAPVYTVACCPAMAVRVLPAFTAGLIMRDGDGGIHVAAYAPCLATMRTSDGHRLELEVETEYPFKEDVSLRLALDAPSACTLNLRIPAWCADATVRINGEAVDGPVRPGFLALSRTWRSGDVITLHLPMPLQVVEVDDSALRGQHPLAIGRGPLLFALPIEAAWKAVAGDPLTPLPAGWTWQEARPLHNDYFADRPWSCVLEADRLRQPGAMQVAYRDIGDAFPWELSPVVVTVPARLAPRAYPNYYAKNVEVHGGSLPVAPDEHRLELVPYGCTNLRISYFPQRR